MTIDPDAIRGRLEKATPGPWEWEATPSGVIIRGPHSISYMRPFVMRIVSSDAPNVEFVTNAYADIRALLAELDSARADNARLQAERDAFEHDLAIEREAWQEMHQAYEGASAALAEAHHRLDIAGIPSAKGVVCDDPTCQSHIGHRVHGLVADNARLREALKLAETDLEAERILNLSDEEVLAGVDVKQQAAEMKVIVDDAVAWSNYYRRVEAAARWYCALNGTERYNRLVEVLNSVPGETK